VTPIALAKTRGAAKGTAPDVDEIGVGVAEAEATAVAPAIFTVAAVANPDMVVGTMTT
jgi:hypothetical protein